MIGKIKDVIRNIKWLNSLYYKTAKHPSERKKFIRGNGNIFKDLGLTSRIRRVVVGDNNYIENGVNANLSNTKIFIKGNNNKIIIGQNTYIDKSSLWIEGDNCELRIGSNGTIVSASFSVAEDNQHIRIGNDCLFSYDVEFKTSDSHSIIDLATNDRINYAQSIDVEEHVWIGSKVSVLKGVTIGRDAIIGTGSIVTKNVPANSIAVGIPAVVTKSNITWDASRL